MFLGPVPVEFGMVFPSGAYAAGGFEKVRDFDRSRGDVVVQQADKATGLPLWVIEVIDPQEGTRQLTVKVKVASEYQPALPPPVAGLPFIAIEFEGLTVSPYVDSSRCKGDGKTKCAARQGYSLKATGVRAPSRLPSRPVSEHKDAA
jgi:hypothetical protein